MQTITVSARTTCAPLRCSFRHVRDGEYICQHCRAILSEDDCDDEYEYGDDECGGAVTADETERFGAGF